MKSQWVCRATKECNELINKTEICEQCGKPCQEELTTGEIVVRTAIPEYILRDIDNIEEENRKLLNAWIMDTERLFTLQQGLERNLDRRIQLQSKMKTTIEGGIRKLRLHKDKGIKWGFDFQRRTFTGLKNPQSKVVNEKI